MAINHFPYLGGRLLCQYSQLAEFLKIHGWTMDYDSERKIKCLYRRTDFPEGLALHHALFTTLQQLINKAKTEETYKAG